MSETHERITARQAAILEDVRRRTKSRGPLTVEEAAETFDGRSFWPLVRRGLLTITKHCGCDHPCACSSTHVTSAPPSPPLSTDTRQ
jgi:hypothetical protein